MPEITERRFRAFPSRVGSIGTDRGIRSASGAYPSQTTRPAVWHTRAMATEAIPISREFPARAIHVADDDGPLVLRPVAMTDAHVLVEATESSLDELKPWMPWAHLPVTAESQVKVLRRFEASYFGGKDMVMGLFRDGALMTMVGLHPRVPHNPKGLEVGYWTPTEVSGRGWATRAARLAALYAFDRLDCDRLQVIHDEENAGSRRVVEKCGFALEGRLKAYAAAPSEELLRGGFRHSGAHLMWGLFEDTFARQPWVGELRETMRYVDISGRPERSARRAPG